MTPDEFVDILFGDEVGFVYVPTKGKYWEQKFFHWPNQRQHIIAHIRDHSDREVYISPSLFSQPIVSPTFFQGTRHVWTEFDGQTPSSPELVPTLRIKSSLENHEHWYWRLDEFTTDVNKVKAITKKIAYHLGADLSGWDYAQVLRPPGTYNHKRNQPVTLIEHNPNKHYSLQEFQIFPELPEDASVTINHATLPKLKDIIDKYKWDVEVYDLLTKDIHKGSRSSALSRLAFETVEMGLSNDEIFTLLEDADTRWGKFIGRTDRDSRLLGLIIYARTQKALTLSKSDKSPIYRFKDFMQTTINIQWVIPGVLPVAGSSVVFGPPEIGKSTWALRMAIAIATGQKEFLGWPIERTQKILFMSLEMPHDELKFFLSQMQLTNEQEQLLQENLFIWPIGHPYPMDRVEYQREILEYTDQFGIQLNIIDSLGVATYGSVKSTDDMKRLFSFLNEDLRKERNCGYMFIHHPRKGTGENGHSGGVDDAFGDSYIINNAQTVINLMPNGTNRIKVSVFKSRLSLDKRVFTIHRNPDRSFSLVSDKTSRPKKEEKVFEGSPNILTLGKLHDRT